jgi:hypothetical protein
VPAPSTKQSSPPAASPGSDSGSVTSRKPCQRVAAQRIGGVFQIGVDALKADKDVEDHEGQQEMHKAEDDGGSL